MKIWRKFLNLFQPKSVESLWNNPDRTKFHTYDNTKTQFAVCGNGFIIDVDKDKINIENALKFEESQKTIHNGYVTIEGPPITSIYLTSEFIKNNKDRVIYKKDKNIRAPEKEPIIKTDIIVPEDEFNFKEKINETV